MLSFVDTIVVLGKPEECCLQHTHCFYLLLTPPSSISLRYVIRYISVKYSSMRQNFTLNKEEEIPDVTQKTVSFKNIEIPDHDARNFLLVIRKVFNNTSKTSRIHLRSMANIIDNENSFLEFKIIKDINPIKIEGELFVKLISANKGMFSEDMIDESIKAVITYTPVLI